MNVLHIGSSLLSHLAAFYSVSDFARHVGLGKCLYLLRVEFSLHYFHEVIIRYSDGHIGFATVWALVQGASSSFQINGWGESIMKLWLRHLHYGTVSQIQIKFSSRLKCTMVILHRESFLVQDLA